MDWNLIWEAYKHVFISDFLRYLVAASIAYLLVWQLLHPRLTHRFIQKKRPTSKQFLKEFRYSVSSVSIYGFIGVGIIFGKQAGIIHIYDEVADYGWGYFGLSIVLMMLWHDFYFYWTHKWMHHPKIYRHVHRIHHQSVTPSPWTAYSFHPIEAFVQAAFLPIILLVMPMNGFALLLFLLYQITRNVVGHLGYEIYPKAFLSSKWLRWHTTTTHHDQHHHYFNHNYGLYFTWWDRIMKTEHPEYEKEFYEVKNRKRMKSSDLGSSLLPKVKQRPKADFH